MEKIKEEELILCNGGGVFSFLHTIAISLISIVKIAKIIKRRLG